MSRPTNKNSQNGSSRWLLSLCLLAVWFGILGLAAHNRQGILDWWRLRGYNAPAAVTQLAVQDTMTPYARKVLYVNRPSIEDKLTFSKACPNNGGEATIVLGCYHSGQNGIFLLSVNDPRLNGVEQVTAAHEMLHAAYGRLSSSERSKVDTMLLDYYSHDLHDPRILSTMAIYKKTEPHDVVNEMHSVFGTEIANLPPGLEQYYKRYFTNRVQIAGYAAQYESELTSRQAAVAQDEAQLASWKTQIDSLEADLKTKQNTINAQQAALANDRSSGDITGYNSGVPAYNNLIVSYNAQVQTVQQLISRYNQLLASRNAIALEENQLINDLSTNLTPINK